MRPFLRDSRAAIGAAHPGQPFVLAFWSVDCAYCSQELAQLQALARHYPGLSLVLVGTDGTDGTCGNAGLPGRDDRRRSTPPTAVKLVRSSTKASMMPIMMLRRPTV